MVMSLRMFQDKSFCTYRVTRGTKTTGSILVYKTVRHCQHFRKYVSRQGMKNTKSVRQKKTQCPSTLTIKVYSSRSTIKKRLQFPNHPCEIQLHYHHNHPTESAHALRFRDVSESTKEAYYRYFQNGHSAATAPFHDLLLTENIAEYGCIKCSFWCTTKVFRFLTFICLHSIAVSLRQYSLHF